mgnify:CR=1 FL=1
MAELVEAVVFAFALIEAATQSVLAVEPSEPPVFVLAEQPVHATAPVALLYLPAAQAVGVPPSVPVNPALATHAVMTVEPVVMPVPLLAGHAVAVPPLTL